MKPARRTKTAILIVGEGPTEKAFLQYLKELYVTRDDDIVVKIECGSGGSPKCVVQKAKRLCGSRAYDKCFVLIDADRLSENDCKINKHTKKIRILKATPNIEGLFLAILQYPNFSQVTAYSVMCKKEFERNYLSGDKKMDKRAYPAIFSREMFEARRKNIPELEEILKGMRGYFLWTKKN
ncbi:MAG: RloB domain-containing protein [bacterium]